MGILALLKGGGGRTTQAAGVHLPPRSAPGVPHHPAVGFLRCSACSGLIRRDPPCSDLGVLTMHWMGEHRERWLELHPEHAEYI